MPKSSQLNRWIAESSSWQSFIDFKLPEDAMAVYSFLKVYDNFYLSLMTRAIELLRQNEEESDKEEMLSVAKGLEIYSLFEKRDLFSGIDQPNNILYASGLYFLSDYSASAWLLSRIYPKKNYVTIIDDFISSFLRRDYKINNRLSWLLDKYLESGRDIFIKLLLRRIRKNKENSFDQDIDLFFSYQLAESIILKFASDNIWKDLLAQTNNREHWKDYVLKNIKKKVPVWSFFPSQKLAIQNGILKGETCSLQMPTSSGKTSISELIIYDEFKKNNDCKILYLTPFRALASELKQSLAVNLGSLGISSKTIFGGNLPTIEERTSVSEVNLVIATPEKFMAIEDIFPGLSEEFSTIICDEGHLLDDESRGLNYELLLSRLKGNNEINKRFIFISAIIPNISVINNWLGGTDETLASSNYKPTELDYGFLKPMDWVKGYFLDINPHKTKPDNYQLYKFLFDDELSYTLPSGKTKKVSNKKSLSVAAAIKATKSGAVALFAPAKGGRSGVYALTEEAINQVYENETFSTNSYLENLVEYFSLIFGEDYLLTLSSRVGILFHTGDFPQNIRDVIEDALRKGIINLVICTNTLAEGVNLPIKTIVIHSARRFNPNAMGNFSPIRTRDLKNLVGRAGRAGKETKGLIIVADPKDFKIFKNLITETEVEPVTGQLFQIVQIITEYLKRNRLTISNEILDELSEELQELLDSIDVSMIDLLSEEVEIDKLKEIINDHIKETLSYFQSNDQEKKTLTTLFEFRAEKLKPFLENGEFKILKQSGTNIRLFEEINSHFDFNNDIWNKEFQPLDNNWLIYMLDDGIFKLNRFVSNLEEFNRINRCDLSSEEIKTAIILWMSGEWYLKISDDLEIDIQTVLKLIHSFISFNIQSIISAVIRIKELTDTTNTLSSNILNWSSFLQHGIDSQLNLDLIEMGLIDRIAVLKVAETLKTFRYSHIDYKQLRAFLSENGVEILRTIKPNLPVISYEKLNTFIKRLRNRYVL